MIDRRDRNVDSRRVERDQRSRLTASFGSPSRILPRRRAYSAYYVHGCTHVRAPTSPYVRRICISTRGDAGNGERMLGHCRG